MRIWNLFPLILLIGLAPKAHSQSIEVNRQNRTIEVIATERVRVAAEVANVTLGCIAYGPTHDEAYDANLEIADRVIKALLAAGIQKAQIESDSVELSETSSDEIQNQPSNLRKARQFKAHQSWKVRLPAFDAQKLIDLAVKAGANGIEYVSWDVNDPEALELRARAAAIEKARSNATEIARSAGAKVGDLLYASNSASGILSLLANSGLPSSASASVGKSSSVQRFSLQLFPVPVEKQATIRAVFALD